MFLLQEHLLKFTTVYLVIVPATWTCSRAPYVTYLLPAQVMCWKNVKLFLNVVFLLELGTLTLAFMCGVTKFSVIIENKNRLKCRRKFESIVND